MSNRIFCVDVGGTKTAYAVYDEVGKELLYGQFPTLPQRGLPDLICRLAESVNGKLGDVTHGVIASPGPLDLQTGSIISIATTGWKNLPIVALFEEKFSLPFALLNDCNAGALGAYELYAKARSSVVYVSVSTGIGGGIVLNGKLYNGKGNAAEIGHLPVPGDDLPCACGKSDCLELYASGMGIENRYFAATKEKKSCAELAALAKQGNSVANALFHDAENALAFAMRSLASTIDPDAVVFGGSVCKSKGLFFHKAETYLRGCGIDVCYANEDGKQVLCGAFAYGKSRRKKQ